MATKTSNLTFVSLQKDVHDVSCQDIGFFPPTNFQAKNRMPYLFPCTPCEKLAPS